jgi:hypothetical protein
LRAWGIVKTASACEPITRSVRAVRGHRCFAGLVVGALLASVVVGGGSARAAFPGRNGLLAVQPLTGRGVVLINVHGRGERRVCARPAEPCRVVAPSSRLLRPQWSPDGRALVIVKTGEYPEQGFEVIYPDGSCLDCLSSEVGVGAWADAAFTSNPTLLTTLRASSRGGVTLDELVEYGVDGLERRVLLYGAAADPVWSSRGQLALVRGGWIWSGRPAALRRVTQGSAPSWSPSGRQIVFVRRAWLMVGAVRGRSFRRLVRGAAPAWSPDGASIAFFDKHGRLSVIRAAGGRARRVGGVAGRTVDWQPLPSPPAAPCVTPPGSTVLAASNAAIITASHGRSPFYPYPPGSATMGCLRADGRERLLSSDLFPSYETAGGLTGVALAGPYVAFAGNTFNSHDGTWISFVDLSDLRTGLDVSHRGHEGFTCPGLPCATNVDQLVLGSDAVSAVHVAVQDANCGTSQDPNCRTTLEQIQASDSTGVHTLDSVSEPDHPPAALTNLVLTRDTLTWDDNGTQRSTQLQP